MVAGRERLRAYEGRKPVVEDLLGLMRSISAYTTGRVFAFGPSSSFTVNTSSQRQLRKCPSIPNSQVAGHPQMNIFDSQGLWQADHHDTAQHLAGSFDLGASQHNNVIVQTTIGSVQAPDSRSQLAYRISKRVALCLPVTFWKGLKLGMVC